MPDNYDNHEERIKSIEDLITLRSSFLIERVLYGLRLDFDEAINLLKDRNNSVTEKDRQRRVLLIAAFDNLIDFAAAEEYRMISELPETPDRENFDIYRAHCEKYNLQYATQENEDVLHAASIALWWMGVPEQALVTFMTQGDERVRAWHLSHEGLSFPKNDFPAELIPPVEFGCRCYLITNGFGSVYGSLERRSYAKDINPVFKESLAKGGRIFSPEHPYFKTPLPDEIKEITNRIKHKLNII